MIDGSGVRERQIHLFNIPLHRISCWPEWMFREQSRGLIDRNKLVERDFSLFTCGACSNPPGKAVADLKSPWMRGNHFIPYGAWWSLPLPQMAEESKKQPIPSPGREWLGHRRAQVVFYDEESVYSLLLLAHLSTRSRRFEVVSSPPRAFPGCASQGKCAIPGRRLHPRQIT